ncbi:MAG: hypothetical protein EOO38_24115 [Cytophagaceae bacterium]|nr:MAG: hypothetical protein EOO38_24115 [Cytophagaceae bacterium]
MAARIAIIAILAAILFPVFAQAKEAAKKTASISNAKQTGVAMMVYMTDSDDLMPLAYPCQSEGLVRSYLAGNIQPAYVPDDLFGPIDYQMNTHWINSTQPYRKNYAITTINGAPVFGTVSGNTKAPELTSLSMNGLLSTLPSSGVQSPSVVPMIWPGQGRLNLNGRTSTNPMLDCGAPSRDPTSLRLGMECRFNPGGPPNPANTTTSVAALYRTNYEGIGVPQYTVHGNGTVIVRTDTSAKFIKIGSGTPTAFNNNPYGDPWAAYTTATSGVPTGNYYGCTTQEGARSVTNPSYPCFFRPDRTQ